MNCDYCEDRIGCSLRKKLDDGTAAFSCGIDFGRDKSETVIYESRKGRLVARYSLPDDPHLRSYRDCFDEEFSKRLSKLFAKRVKEIEADIFAWINRNPICYMNPCKAILDGICGVTTPAIYPRDNVAERYDVSEFFIQFPIALPTKLKGIAV
jgi:hypothetical protein